MRTVSDQVKGEQTDAEELEDRPHDRGAEPQKVACDIAGIRRQGASEALQLIDELVARDIDVEPPLCVDVYAIEPSRHTRHELLYLANDQRDHRSDEHQQEDQQPQQHEARRGAPPPPARSKPVDRRLERERQKERDHEPHDQAAHALQHYKRCDRTDDREDHCEDEARYPRGHVRATRLGVPVRVHHFGNRLHPPQRVARLM